MRMSSRRTRRRTRMRIRIYNMSVMVKMRVPERKMDGTIRDGLPVYGQTSALSRWILMRLWSLRAAVEKLSPAHS